MVNVALMGSVSVLASAVDLANMAFMGEVLPANIVSTDAVELTSSTPKSFFVEAEI